MRGAVSLAAALAIPLTTDAGAPFPGPRPDRLPRLLRHPRDARRSRGCSLPLVDPRARARGRRARRRRRRRRRASTRPRRRSRGWTSSSTRTGSATDTAERMRGALQLPAQPLRARGSTTATTARSRSARSPTSALRRELLEAERAAVVALRNEGRISDEVMHRVQRDLDLEDSRLDCVALSCPRLTRRGRLLRTRTPLRRACAGRGAPSGRRSTRGRARASRPSTSRSRGAPARSRSARAARRAAASTRAARGASSSKKRGRIGRGPTRLMSPRSTFKSCGISSSCVARSQRPSASSRLACGATSSSPR